MDNERWLTTDGFKGLLSTMSGAKGEDLWSLQAQLLDDRASLIGEIEAAHALLDWMNTPRAYTTGEVLTLSARVGRAIELAQRPYRVD